MQQIHDQLKDRLLHTNNKLPNVYTMNKAVAKTGNKRQDFDQALENR